MGELTIDEVMAAAPEGWRYRWCNSGWCACMGCANATVLAAGFSKADWDEWMTRTPGTGGSDE